MTQSERNAIEAAWYECLAKWEVRLKAGMPIEIARFRYAHFTPVEDSWGIRWYGNGQYFADYLPPGTHLMDDFAFYHEVYMAQLCTWEEHRWELLEDAAAVRRFFHLYLGVKRPVTEDADGTESTDGDGTKS